MGNHQNLHRWTVVMVTVAWIASSFGASAKGTKVKTPEADAPPPIDKSVSAEEALHMIVSLLPKSLAFTDVRVTAEGVSYVVKKSISQTLDFNEMQYANSPEHAYGVWCVRWTKSRSFPPCWNDQSDAQSFLAAMNRMIWENSPEGTQERERQQAQEQAFERQLAGWRASGSKVEIPEEAQRHYVLAQQAFQEKDFRRQAEELSAALAIYPTWPAEQFDLALILGELNRYSDAVQHMQMYLQLTPDAPDAQKAKERIWVWQDKDKRGSN